MQNDHGTETQTNRLIVAYHHPHNLKNLLFPRCFASQFDYLPSTVLANLKADS
jgi:hypothetical protein